MATITKRGRELADSLVPHLNGLWHAPLNAAEYDVIAGLCSRIARLSVTHHHLQETACNRSLTPSEAKRDAQIEAAITTLVATLSSATGTPMEARFQGDPRGYTVRVKLPHVPHAGNTWGLGGEFGI